MTLKKGLLSVSLSIALLGTTGVITSASSSVSAPNEVPNISGPFKISAEQEAQHLLGKSPTVALNSVATTNQVESESTSLTGDFSEPTKITPEQEAAHLASNPPTVTFGEGADQKQNINGLINPMYYTGYTITKLPVGSYIQSNSQVYLSSTKDINLTLVQYPYYGRSGTTHLYYKLVRQSSGTDTSEIGVKGNYSDSNVTISFPNVAPGWYKIQISNYSSDGGPDAMGNGHTNDGNQQ